MKQFLFYLKRLPKRAAIMVALFAALVAIPLQTVIAANIKLEGSIGVRNISVDSSSNNQYQTSTNATYNQVVEFRVFYHNMELPDSGKVAENLKVKVDFPNAPGRTQVVKATISADDANTVTDTATVNLDRDDAYLEFIPTSVKWEHNPGARTDNRITEAIADSKILNGEVLENAKPCYEYQAYVYFQARVFIPSVGVYKTVRQTPAEGAAKTDMQKAITANPGATVDYVVSAKNLSSVNLTNVYLRDQLPQGVTYVPGSAKKTYGQYNKEPMDDTEVQAFFTGRKNVGTLLPGAEAFITFKGTVTTADKLACGANALKNIAVVDTDQTGEYNSNAVVNVAKECANVPSYSCDLFKVEKGANRIVTVTEFKTLQNNGATFKDVKVDWGDNSSAIFTNPVDQKHQYASDGPWTITATARFNVNGEVKEHSGNCVQQVSFSTTPPVALPNTGAGDVLGIFAATTVAGAVAHRFVWARRFARGL